MGAQYIGTELEVRADFDFATLHDELTRARLYGAVNVHNGVWFSSYGSVPDVQSPEGAVEYLLGIVENLGAVGRAEWDRCSARRFDLGFTNGVGRSPADWSIKAPLLSRLAAVNGELMVTVYYDDDPPVYAE